MKRRVMQLLFAVGLLLTLAASALWVRTVWVTDYFTTERVWVEGASYVIEYISIEFSQSGFGVAWGWDKTTPQIGLRRVDRASAPWRVSYYARSPRPFVWPSAIHSSKWWERLGFFRRIDQRRPPGGAIIVPPWFAVLGSTVLTTPPLLWLLRDRQHRKRRAGGLCLCCGYDLRGADHERCPECGGTVPAKVQVAV